MKTYFLEILANFLIIKNSDTVFTLLIQYSLKAHLAEITALYLLGLVCTLAQSRTETCPASTSAFSWLFALEHY